MFEIKKIRRLGMLHVAVALLCLPVTARGQKQVTHDDLRTLAREAIAKKEVIVDPPQLTPKAGILSDNLGGAWYVIDPESQEYDLLTEVVLKEQLGVEVIRIDQRAPDRQTFWKPYLQQVEALIAQQLAIVQHRSLSTDAQFERVMNLREKVRGVYLRALAALAQQLGVRLETSRPFRHPRTVEFQTNPGNARIYVSHLVESRLAALQGRRPKWRAVPNPQHVQLEGKYHYLIQWPQRTTAGQRPVNIDRDGAFLLE